MRLYVSQNPLRRPSWRVCPWDHDSGTGRLSGWRCTSECFWAPKPAPKSCGRLFAIGTAAPCP
jgi:hypothetical protein